MMGDIEIMGDGGLKWLECAAQKKARCAVNITTNARSFDFPLVERLQQDVGEAAKAAFKKGVPADEAWRTYEVPASLGEYSKFRPDVYRFAFEAWYRELKG